MRKLLPFFLLVIVLASFAGWQLDISRLFPTLQPISVVLSIMAAAIFVRLNRGMPTLDWKAISSEERVSITDRMVDIAYHYVVGLALSGVSILTLVGIVGLGAHEAAAMPSMLQAIVVGWFVLIVGLSTVWMGYVIWRDYDIMMLQKKVIDQASIREQQEKDLQMSREKAAAMKSSSVAVAPTAVRPFQGK